MFFSIPRRARVRRQADELPGALPDLRDAAALLSRAAGALRRFRPTAPRRAVRDASRPHPGAQLWRRTTPTSSARPRRSRPRSRTLLAHGRGDVRGLRLRATQGVPVDPPGEVDRQRRACGSSAEGGARRRAARRRHGVRDQPGRGGLLRTRRSTSTSSTSSSARGSWRRSRSTSRHAGALRPRKYVTPEGTMGAPVMIHRAVLGSIERFMGILSSTAAGPSRCGWRRSRCGC